MTVPYTFKFKNLAYESVPNDVIIKFQGYLSDINSLPFVSGNQLDLIDVATTKTSLPTLPINYQTFFETVIASYIYNKYSFTTNASIVYNSSVISGLTSTSNVKVGMRVTTTPESYTYNVTSNNGYPQIKINSANTSELYVGMSISGTGIATGTLISEILSGTIARTANTTISSATLTNIDTTDLFPGMKIVGPSIPADAKISTIVSSTSLTMTQVATATQTNVTIVLDQTNFVKMSNNSGATSTSNFTFFTGLQSNAEVTKILSDTSIEINLPAVGTIDGLEITFNTDNWLIDYSSLSQVLSLINHSNL